MAFAHRIVFSRVTDTQKHEMRDGLEKYCFIMAGRDNVQDIRNVFVDFYFVPKKSRNKILNEDRFFELMSQRLPDAKTFATRLIEKGISNEIMMSFSSKAVHTYYDNRPIYDSHVIAYLKTIRGLRLPANKPFMIYDKLAEWYGIFVNSEEADVWVEWFDGVFPDYANISRIKKIDMILYKISIASTKGLKLLARSIGIIDEEISASVCRKLAKIVYGDFLTDEESLQLIKYFGIDTKAGSNAKRKEENCNGIEKIIGKVKSLY